MDMTALMEHLQHFAQFMEMGGSVLWLIAALVFVMWCLIVERFIYFMLQHQRLSENWIAGWQQRTDKGSWYAQHIRQALLSRARLSIDRNLPLIRTLVMLCPLFGLLGTVTGMIEVFTVLALTGGGDIQSLAGGISRATLPTLAGMVAAISGVFSLTWLHKKSAQAKELLNDQLVITHR